MISELNAILRRDGVGECAAIEEYYGERFLASVYLRSDFRDSALLARWFHELGATMVIVQHTLYCDYSGDREGITPDGQQAWNVIFAVTDEDVPLKFDVNHSGEG